MDEKTVKSKIAALRAEIAHLETLLPVEPTTSYVTTGWFEPARVTVSFKLTDRKQSGRKPTLRLVE